MRYLIVPTLLGVLVMADTAAAQFYEPPHSYPVPGQYYPEEPANLVRHWYRKYLNREGDPGGVANWVTSLRQGNPPEAVLATILASEEYLRKAGGTPEGLVRALFLDLTGRPPRGPEYSYWLSRLHRGDRIDVIYDMLLRYPPVWSGGAPAPLEEEYSYRRPYRYYRR